MVIAPTNVISPRTLSNRAGIDIEIIFQILTLLSSFKLIDTKFMLECSNDDQDEVDLFIFDSKTDLNEFIKRNNEVCPSCSSELSLKNAYVTFRAKRLSIQGANDNEK